MRKRTPKITAEVEFGICDVRFKLESMEQQGGSNSISLPVDKIIEALEEQVPKFFHEVIDCLTDEKLVDKIEDLQRDIERKRTMLGAFRKSRMDPYTLGALTALSPLTTFWQLEDIKAKAKERIRVRTANIA